MSFKFIIYSTPTCPYCDKAKELITEQGMGYAEASLDTQEKIDEFKKTTGHRTVPQIYLATDEQEYIGGFEDLEKFILDMVVWRNKQNLMSDPSGGMSPPNVTVREHGNRGISIDVSEKDEMKDVTPEPSSR